MIDKLRNLLPPILFGAAWLFILLGLAMVYAASFAGPLAVFRGESVFMLKSGALFCLILGLLIFFAYVYVTSPRSALMPVIVVATVLILALYGSWAGGRKGQAIDSLLPHYDVEDFERMDTSRYTIYYQSESQAQRLAERIENITDKILEDLGFSPEFIPEGRTRIFLCRDKREYDLRFKGKDPLVGGHADWRKKTIFIYQEKNLYSAMLPHELTHIILGQATGCDLAWVHEGIAEYVEMLFRLSHDRSRMSFVLDPYLSILKNGNHIYFKDFLDIANPWELEDTSKIQVYYYQAFSLVYFLSERYGRDKFHDFLKRLRKKQEPKHALLEAYQDDFEDQDDMEGAWLVFFTL